MQASTGPIAPVMRGNEGEESEEGDAAAESSASGTRLARCVREHFAAVHRFLRGLGVPADAVDDAAQDVFLVAAKRIDEVRDGSEKAYFYSTAVRIAHVVRRRHVREQPTEDIEESAGADARTPADLIDQKRAEELLAHLLSGLSEELRSAFLLYEIEEMTLAEIAAILDLPRGTAASRVRRAREEFQRRLERHRKRTQGEP